MSDEEAWVKTLADGKRVKFTYQQFSVDGAFITPQIAGNEVLFSAKPIQRSAMNENWNIGVRERFGAGARFAQACKALPLHHLYFLNN
jgi:hypothetical protein